MTEKPSPTPPLIKGAGTELEYLEIDVCPQGQSNR